MDDDCQLLIQPITAYGLEVRYDKITCLLCSHCCTLHSGHWWPLPRIINAPTGCKLGISEHPLLRPILKFILYKYDIPLGIPWWNVSRGRMVFPEGEARGKTILPRMFHHIPSWYPQWDVIFVLLYQTNLNLVKYQWKNNTLTLSIIKWILPNS